MPGLILPIRLRCRWRIGADLNHQLKSSPSNRPSGSTARARFDTAIFQKTQLTARSPTIALSRLLPTCATGLLNGSVRYRPLLPTLNIALPQVHRRAKQPPASSRLSESERGTRDG